MDKARKPTYIWLSTFEVLKEINQRTNKPMTALLDEAVALLAQRYIQKGGSDREVSTTDAQ
jgi:predicted NBD/HSP70 family sugar kinase